MFAIVDMPWSIRVHEIHFRSAGHFVWRTSNPSPDILNSCKTFHCEMLVNIKLFAVFGLLLLAKGFDFAGHFSIFAGHVRRIQRISHTLKYGKGMHCGCMRWTTNSPRLLTNTRRCWTVTHKHTKWQVNECSQMYYLPAMWSINHLRYCQYISQHWFSSQYVKRFSRESARTHTYTSRLTTSHYALSRW